jgi:hypothetical protein
MEIELAAMALELAQVELEVLGLHELALPFRRRTKGTGEVADVSDLEIELGKNSQYCGHTGGSIAGNSSL